MLQKRLIKNPGEGIRNRKSKNHLFCPHWSHHINLEWKRTTVANINAIELLSENHKWMWIVLEIDFRASVTDLSEVIRLLIKHTQTNVNGGFFNLLFGFIRIARGVHVKCCSVINILFGNGVWNWCNLWNICLYGNCMPLRLSNFPSHTKAIINFWKSDFCNSVFFSSGCLSAFRHPNKSPPFKISRDSPIESNYILRFRVLIWSSTAPCPKCAFYWKSSAIIFPFTFDFAQLKSNKFLQITWHRNAI